jgi:BirA family transcriptional regulator, biotin operon repressor / biotin---[acetyl-CoA-carboxylase] ligase
MMNPVSPQRLADATVTRVEVGRTSSAPYSDTVGGIRSVRGSVRVTRLAPVPVPAALTGRPEAPPLATTVIERWVADAALPETLQVETVARTGSTNEDLLVRARRCRPDGPLLLAADEQTSGRGRQQRRWVARPRTALLFSLSVPLAGLPAALPAVTLSCGVALADYLIGRGVQVTLKWPNDLLLDGRKLAGILCELAVDADGHATLVVGVGINGSLNDADRADIGQTAAALEEIVPWSLLAGEREAWIAALAGVVLLTVRRFVGEGFIPWRARFNELLDARGQRVDIVDAGHVVASGRVVEVDTIGRLMLATADGSRSINVGDVSLRSAPPDDAAD